MRALLNGVLVGLVGLGIACGGEGTRKRCSNTDECGAGMECTGATDSDQGVCVKAGNGHCLDNCGRGEVRSSGECQCVSKYQVAVSTKSGSALIGTVGKAQIVVTVTKGSQDVASLSTSAVGLTANGTAVTELVSSPSQPVHTSATVDTYTFNYTVSSDQETDVSLVATAAAGTDDERVSDALKVSVDTKAPRVNIALGGGGGFGGGATIGVTVTVADAHPSTGDLTLQLNGGSESLTLTSSSSSTADGVTTLTYSGQLTPQVMAAKSLPCTFDMSVTASDTLSSGSSDSAHQMTAVISSTGITCGSGMVCAPQALYACNPTYTISMSGISNTAPLTTTDPKTITVAVTKGAASVTTADPSLSSGGASGVSGRTGPVTSADGLTGTYTWTYTPQSNTEGTYSFQASVGSGADRKTATVSNVIVDNVAPRIGVSFGGTQSNGKYLRTDTASIGVIVTDANLPTSDRITVQATLDGTTVLGPANYSAGGGGGGGNRSYTVPLDLKGLSFDKLEKTLAVQVSAVTDNVGNQSSSPSFSVSVTRLRWVTADAANVTDMTTPAIDGSGNLYAGRTSTDGNTAKVVKIDRDTGAISWASSVLGGSVAATPAVGGAGLWAGSVDGKIALINPSNGNVVSVGGGSGGQCVCDTASHIWGSPAVVVSSADTAVFGATNGKLYTLPSGVNCKAGGPFQAACSNATSIGTGTLNPIYDPPVVSGVNIYVGNWAGTQSFLWGTNWNGVQLTLPGGAGFGAPALDGTNVWAAVVPDSGVGRYLVSAPLNPGTLNTVLPAGGVYAASTTPVLVKTGEVLIGMATLNQDGTDFTKLYLGRVNSSNPNWKDPIIDGYSNGALVLKDSNNASVFVVPTNAGKVYQFDKDGNPAWSGSLSSNTELHEGNIYTDSNGVSTAYFGSKDGHVYAVIVDGTLDTSSPWPRVGHDPQNTGHAN